jgi:hypothetical protein
LHHTSTVSKILFIVPTDAHYYKIILILKQYKNYNTCSNMLQFTHKPSSGSSPVPSQNYEMVFFVLVGIDKVNVIVAYQPVVQVCGHSKPHACTTG